MFQSFIPTVNLFLIEALHKYNLKQLIGVFFGRSLTCAWFYKLSRDIVLSCTSVQIGMRPKPDYLLSFFRASGGPFVSNKVSPGKSVLSHCHYFAVVQTLPPLLSFHGSSPYVFKCSPVSPARASQTDGLLG